MARKWNPNNKIVPITAGLAAAAADGVAVVGAAVSAADEEYRVLSMKGTWTVRDLAPSAGPVVVGFAHGDYTATEVEEALEAEAAMNRGDKIANEKARRLVRRVGVFNTTEQVLNDGKPISTRLNWHIPEGTVINLFVYNQTGATITAGSVQFNGTIFLRYG